MKNGARKVLIEPTFTPLLPLPFACIFKLFILAKDVLNLEPIQEILGTGLEYADLKQLYINSEMTECPE